MDQPEEAARAVSTLEHDLVTAGTRTEFDALFKRAQVLVKHLEQDQSLGPQERAAVERHVRDILKRGRIDYERNRAHATSALVVSVDRLELFLETLAEAGTIAAVQEVRADLRLIRESMQAAAAWAPLKMQARAWELWQSANQTAWNTLNQLWRQNEISLATVLDRAETELERGNLRAAKTQIKEFHEQAKTSESSHASMKVLRVRAREIWNRTTVASKERHEAYVVTARKRLGYMRTLLGRVHLNRQRVESDVSKLELDLQRAQTDVASALLRGQLAERRKQLRHLDSETADLVQRINEAEKIAT